MKLKFIAAALCMTFGLSLFAQNNATPTKKDNSPKCNIEQLTKDLNLSDKQAKELNALQEERRSKRDAMRQQRSEEKDKRQAEADTRRAEAEKDKAAYQEKVKSILTPEQYTKYQELQKQNRRDGKKGKDGKFHKDCRQCDKKSCKGENRTKVDSQEKSK